QTVKNNMMILHRENQKRKKKLRLGVNIVISQLNYEEIPEILAFVEEIGWQANVDIYRWLSATQVETDELKIAPSQKLRDVLEVVKQSPVVFIPDWLIDGYCDYLLGKTPKYCPYIDAPGLGSKFFIQPNGNLKVCLGEPAGNLIKQTPAEIFASQAWKNKMAEFKACTGCWNTCYTRNARPMKYFTDFFMVGRFKKRPQQRHKYNYNIPEEST
ncbi:MAG: hypothetical protein K8S56_01610, partial [Candidatus Cloacimonetes bacterium]|nr:hypothetical protein [Candidatus Cloacimonadota bacterium]